MLIEARLKILPEDDLNPSMSSCPRCVDPVFIGLALAVDVDKNALVAATD